MTRFFGGDAAAGQGLVHRAGRWLRLLAAKLHLIPGSMRGERLLCRILFGTLHPMPAELAGLEAPYCVPEPILSTEPNRRYRVLYSVVEVA